MAYVGKVGILPGYDKSKNTYTDTSGWGQLDVITHMPDCLQLMNNFTIEDSEYRGMIKEFNAFRKAVRETGEWEGRKINVNEGETLVFGSYPQKAQTPTA